LNKETIMNKREAQRLNHQQESLMSLGFTRDESDKLRRISMTLHRWHELECGTGEGQTSYSIERDGDEPDSKPYMRIQYPTTKGYVDRRYPVADRETGAKKRLARIVDACNKARLTHMTDGKMTPQSGLRYYIQTDPRSVALYIIRPGDIPEGQTVESSYSRGIVVY
jgi:hypothetical protein